MNENLSIIFQLIIFLFFFSTPINIFNKNIIFKNRYLNLYDCFSLNIFIHLNFFLIYSFLNLSAENYFYLILILNTIFNFFYLKKFNNYKFSLNEIYVFIIFIVILLSIFFDISANLRLEWDALSHWIYKARNFYDGGDIQNLKNLEFAEYPHLGTYIWGFFWKNSLVELEYFGRLFYVFFYVVTLFAIHKYIFKKNLFLIFLSLIFIILITYDPFILSGYQEYLIFSTLVIISRFVLVFRTNIKNLLILLLISHLLMWFKDEGLFYFIIFSSIITFFSKESYKNKTICFIIILTLPIIQFFLQGYIIGNFSFQAELIHSDLINILNLKIFLSKFILILKFIIISVIKYNLTIIYLLSLILFLFFYNTNLSLIKLFFILFIFNFGLFFAIYLHTPYDLEFLLRVTLDRLIFQTSGLYLIVILFGFKKINKSIILK